MAEQEYEEVDDAEGEDQFDDSITDDDINNLVTRAEKAETNNMNLTRSLSAMHSEKKDGNILHLQISTDEMLAKLEHFYRGDVYSVDDDGEHWNKPEDKDLITFNEYGVSSLMEVVTKYIDRNTILSYYNEERIYEILGDLGDELVLFILCNYVKMGLDTNFKKTKFRMIITTTLHIIESTYRRALRGKTIEEINQSRVIGQFGEIPKEISRPAQVKKGWIQRFVG